MIVIVNKGQLPLKVRGKKKDDLLVDFKTRRQEVLDSIKASGTSDESKFKAVSVERYADTHEGRTPAQDGHETSWRFHMGKLRECVLIPMQDEGEWTVRVSDKEEIQQRTRIDDGTAVLREGQQQAKMHQARQKMVSAVLESVVEEEEQDDEEEGPQEQDEDSASSHGSILDDDGSDDDVLGIVAKASGKKKSGSKAKAKAGGKAGATATARAGTKVKKGNVKPSSSSKAAASTAAPPAAGLKG